MKNIHRQYGFDFVALGLTAYFGAPLRWVYGAGATSNRYLRIALSPGRGIGGIVIKSGRPMLFLDIDKQIDPREYSSYPIVFAEDLHSFCALPLLTNGRVVGCLLCAFRSAQSGHKACYEQLIQDIGDTFLNFKVISAGFMNIEGFADADASLTVPTGSYSALSQIINAQEGERKRISRELHDGIAQELLSASFLVRQMQGYSPDERSSKALDELNGKIESILGELHNLSVELRPSALDDLGLEAALKSQAVVFERTYGTTLLFTGKLSQRRFNQSLETQIYRICQEAVLNACKYSENDTVRISLEDRSNWVHVVIADEGRGFNTNNPPIKGSGCGLSGMRERANLIGATLTVESSAKGTVVTLVAPMGPQKSATKTRQAKQNDSQ